MRSGVIVVDQPAGELSGSETRGPVGASVGPLSKKGLDEALSLAVGTGSVRFGSRMAHVELATQLGKEVGEIAGAVVGHDPVDLDAVAFEEADGTAQESRCGLGLFIGQDLDIGQTGEIVDGHMSKLPPRPTSSGSSVAMNAMTHSFDASQLLDVEVDELPGPVAFVTDDGFDGLEETESLHAATLEDRCDRRARHPQLSGDFPTRQTATTELENQVRAIFWGPGGYPMGPGASVLKAPRTFLPESPKPLVGCSLADAEDSRLVLRPGLPPQEFDDMPSTIGAGSGITVDVHPGALLVSPVPKQRKTDRETPGGQPQLLNNLPGHHT